MCSVTADIDCDTTAYQKTYFVKKRILLLTRHTKTTFHYE